MGGLVTVLIPALNEREGIASTVRAVPRSALEAMGYQVQVLVVDNGSTDGTGEVARGAGADVITQPLRGYGNALRAGLAAAKGQIIATSDADATYPLEDLHTILKTFEEEKLDFATTNRFAFMDASAMSFSHKFGNRSLNLAASVLFGFKSTDCRTGIMPANGMQLKRAVAIAAGITAHIWGSGGINEAGALAELLTAAFLVFLAATAGARVVSTYGLQGSTTQLDYWRLLLHKIYAFH